MRQTPKSQRKSGFVWLASMTMLAIVTSAATTTHLSRSDFEKGNGKSRPEFRLTGFRYYLRKHNRLHLAMASKRNPGAGPGSQHHLIMPKGLPYTTI
jgi:hypothetical protein